MTSFACPVCGLPLRQEGSSLRCENRHSYDISKYGYVNLLMSNASSAKRHGDDKLMVRARRDFLDKGYYQCLLEALCREAEPHLTGGAVILDAGCGECWYSSGLKDYLASRGLDTQLLGVDISRDALVIASKRRKDMDLAVASIYQLPVQEASADLVLNFFAPCQPQELARVLRPGGILIRAVPLERHLYGLKEQLYAKPYLNKPADPELEGFWLLKNAELREYMTITDPQDIQNLFKMTPYYYKTSAADQQRFSQLRKLDTEIEFGLRIYQKP